MQLCPMMTNRMIAACGALMLPVTLHAQEGVTRMCLDRDAADVCNCATAGLQAELPAEDFALYDRIGTDYMNRMEGGETMVEAWDAAVAGAGSRISVTNDLGRAHRDAIKACSN